MSPEETAADRDLSAAISEALRAFDLVEDGEVPIDWAVVGVAQSPETPGVMRMFTLMPGGTIALYRLIGLLRTHLTRYEHMALPDGDGDDE